jgi:hypothetical protein
VTPRSWENWKPYYEQRGYRVLTPACPGFEVEVDALNADPTPIEKLSVPAVIDHLTEVIGGLERPPILMSHSAGGTFTQLMLDRGYGAVGVTMNSAPTEGVPVVPLSQLKSTFPVLRTIGAQEGCRLHLRAVALRVHQHLHRGGVQDAVPALPHPGIGGGAMGQRAGHPGARPPRHLRQLQKTTTERRCCSSPAPRTTSSHPASNGPTPSTTSPTL